MPGHGQKFALSGGAIRYVACGQDGHPWPRGCFALPMPSPTLGDAGNTHANPGFYSDTHTECDPGGNANCDTDSDTRYSSPAAAHPDPHARPF